MLRIGKLRIKVDYLYLVLYTIIFSIIAWWAALYYGKDFATATYAQAQLPLLGYTMMVGASLFILFDQRIAQHWAIIPMALSVVFAFTSLLAKHVDVMALLLIGSVMLLALWLPFVPLHNYFGLITLAVILTYTTPVALFVVQNEYLSTTFLWQLTPQLASYLFFLLPSFAPTRQLNQWLSAGLGILLVVLVLLQPLNWLRIVAIAVVVVTWFAQQSFGKFRRQLTTYTGLQLIFILLFY